MPTEWPERSAESDEARAFDNARRAARGRIESAVEHAIQEGLLGPIEIRFVVSRTIGQYTSE